MDLQVITAQDDLLIRRMRLAPGEAMFWHTDRCRRFSVVIGGERLAIEFQDGGTAVELDVQPGLADWDEPEDRVHRAVNTGSTPYEEIVTFYLTAPGLEPQPPR